MAEEESTMTDPIGIGELGRSLIRIERKLDGSLADHETRLRALERWMYVAIGSGAAGAAAGIGALIQGTLGP